MVVEHHEEVLVGVLPQQRPLVRQLYVRLNPLQKLLPLVFLGQRVSQVDRQCYLFEGHVGHLLHYAHDDVLVVDGGHFELVDEGDDESIGLGVDDVGLEGGREHVHDHVHVVDGLGVEVFVHDGDEVGEGVVEQVGVLGVLLHGRNLLVDGESVGHRLVDEHVHPVEAGGSDPLLLQLLLALLDGLDHVGALPLPLSLPSLILLCKLLLLLLLVLVFIELEIEALLTLAHACLLLRGGRPL
mmetsp:Transcript_8608/g.14546  ORF Transcript_8608/g.14546 Transcript_8608/m.14546 type:complete len:241 (+) Transcript_8608:836-1558(+)